MADLRDVITRVEDWSGSDSDWERVPHDPVHTRQVDSVIALVFAVVGILGTELMRSMDALSGTHVPIWVPGFAVLTAAIPLVFRRSFPLVVTALLSMHMLITGLTMPIVMASLRCRSLLFALFTGVAWARDRRAMRVVVGGVILVMAAWIV